ncbi:TPA: adenosine deaminase [Staphylococcus aureus]|nr:adenosine deaminase [Staphylococcus aureus]HEA0030437.1 adenosine deaminase [Staphylococcus aureus]HEA0057474.1 adenosine deaminase [Staphylococcus aureus]HEA0057898.1 adenosine deaminase [Staphylococcus aureus]HEA0065538.1 adenosine deaminase [Staphylococcus aureus]
MTNIKKLTEIPKIELHCHLDGSVSYEYLKSQSKKQKIQIDMNKVTVGEHCERLDYYLKSFDEILKVMQTEESLIESVLDVVKQAEQDGIKYIEIRYAPKLHTQKNLKILEVLLAVCKGAELAESQCDVITRLIVCGMKHYSNFENIEILKHVLKNKDLQQYIVGMDLAGGEEDNSIGKYSEAIEYAKNNNFNITIHAGECGCIKNVYDSVELGAKRIGHGVALLKSEQEIKEFSKRKVLLEICPKSNVQTKAIKCLEDLDIELLKQYNVPYLINTDNRTVTGTTLIKEYRLLLENNLISMDEIKRINKEAIGYTFIDKSEIELLMKKIL